LQALIGQADTLDGHAAELREIARTGGNEALSARAAAEAAKRRHAEATDMRAARAALVMITGPPGPPTPKEQRESAQQGPSEGRPDEHPR
jgi:cell division GTPase FtsZ